MLISLITLYVITEIMINICIKQKRFREWYRIYDTAQNMKFSNMGFFSKSDQIDYSMSQVHTFLWEFSNTTSIAERNKKVDKLQLIYMLFFLNFKHCWRDVSITALKFRKKKLPIFKTD